MSEQELIQQLRQGNEPAFRWLVLTRAGGDWDIFYVDEPSHNGKEECRIKAKGTMINESNVIERTAQPDGALKIMLEEKGKDGNDFKPATFHHVLLIDNNKFTMTKLVRFDGETTFFQRNQYSFNR